MIAIKHSGHGDHFNWALSVRQQVFDEWTTEGKDVSTYKREEVVSGDYDETELSQVAEVKIQAFQHDGAKHAGIFHHVITLSTYHKAAQSTDDLAKDYFGEQGMLAYVKEVQRQEVRSGLACVKHEVAQFGCEAVSLLLISTQLDEKNGRCSELGTKPSDVARSSVFYLVRDYLRLGVIGGLVSRGQTK